MPQHSSLAGRSGQLANQESQCKGSISGGCSRPFLDLFSLQPSCACSGDYCRSHGPYIVGSSSAITPRKGSLSHVGGSSSATSSLQGFLQDSGQHSLACVLVFLGRQSVVVSPPTRNASAKVQSPPGQRLGSVFSFG